MSPAQPVPTPHQDTDPDEIDLRKLVATLWQQRKTIVAIGIGGAVIGLAVSLLSTKYVSSGLFQIPKSAGKTTSISTSNYKSYENILLNPKNLEQFLNQRAKEGASAATELLELTKHPNRIRETITPEFSLTEKEQRTYGIKLSAEEANILLGFRVRHSSDSPTYGTALTLLGEYLRNTITTLELRVYTEERCKDNELREAQLFVEQLRDKFMVEQEEERIQRLKRLIAQSPNATAADTRQVISLENNGARFLAPSAHLNAAEIVVTDIKLSQKERDRERVASGIKKSYYCEANKLTLETAAAHELLDKLLALQTEALKGQDNTLDIVQQTENELQLELSTWRGNYLRTMRYVAAPETLENKERKPGPALGLLGGGLLGGFLGVIFALLWSWWQNNRSGILAEQS